MRDINDILKLKVDSNQSPYNGIYRSYKELKLQKAYCSTEYGFLRIFWKNSRIDSKIINFKL